MIQSYPLAARQRFILPLILLATITFVPRAGFAGPIVIDTVPIGNAGNTADSTGHGNVAYEYRIGAFEVTNSQYAAFLSSVAAADSFGLYDTRMDSSVHGGIARGGSPGSYTYAAKPGRENMPVNFVFWTDTARFANWLHNGQPTGPQNALTTEDGAYSLNGVLTDNAAIGVVRNPGATWWLPNLNEWYKAAYHQNDGVTSNYWNYPTSSDAAPNNAAPPGGTNSANYWPTLGTVAPIGSYTQSDSPYGTFDQGGNVWEINENIESGARTIYGGSWSSFDYYLEAGFGSPFDTSNPNNDFAGIGFRVATVAVPEASSLVLAGMGGACLLGWRMRRRAFGER